MKNLRLVTPAVLSLLNVAIAPKVNATPEGIEVTTGSCYVQFDHSGK